MKVADELTYQQIVFLAHFGDDERRRRKAVGPVPRRIAEELERVRHGGSPIGAELMELGAKGLLVVNAGGQRGHLPATVDAQAIVHFRTGLIDANTVGRDLHRLMRLSTISDEEIEALIDTMQGALPVGA